MIRKMPGYQVAFDNINIQQKARHKMSTNSNERFDLVQGVAIQDRVNVEHLCDQENRADILTLENSKWLLNKDEHQTIQNTLEVLVKRGICAHMSDFKTHYSDFVEKHIVHPFHKEMSKRSTLVSMYIHVLKYDFAFCSVNFYTVAIFDHMSYLHHSGIVF